MAVPRSKFDRVVLTEVLVEAGLTAIHEAERSSKMTSLARANRVRNGLMVAFACSVTHPTKELGGLGDRGAAS
jgi:hypothetical protein